MTELIYKIIKPETEVRATLVCVHGMQEYHARYMTYQVMGKLLKMNWGTLRIKMAMKY